MTLASIWYLARIGLYEDEKPYMTTFDTSAFGCKNTNHEYKQHEVSITDVRGNANGFLLDRHGFQFLNWKTKLCPQEFDDDELVRKRYYPEIIELAQAVFPAVAEIHIIEHLVNFLTY
jgi:hypothetical protein